MRFRQQCNDDNECRYGNIVTFRQSFSCGYFADEGCVSVKKGSNCSCPDQQFKCLSGDCIPEVNRCNGRRECSDGSDERNCSACTGNSTFMCGNRNCILKRERCNRRDTCGDGSDEVDCMYCRQGQFTCDNRRACLDVLDLCDGYDDCGDNSDEIHCGITAQFILLFFSTHVRYIACSSV